MLDGSGHMMSGPTTWRHTYQEPKIFFFFCLSFVVELRKLEVSQGYDSSPVHLRRKPKTCNIPYNEQNVLLFKPGHRITGGRPSLFHLTRLCTHSTAS